MHSGSAVEMSNPAASMYLLGIVGRIWIRHCNLSTKNWPFSLATRGMQVQHLGRPAMSIWLSWPTECVCASQSLLRLNVCRAYDGADDEVEGTWRRRGFVWVVLEIRICGKPSVPTVHDSKRRMSNKIRITHCCNIAVIADNSLVQFQLQIVLYFVIKISLFLPCVL